MTGQWGGALGSSHGQGARVGVAQGAAQQAPMTTQVPAPMTAPMTAPMKPAIDFDRIGGIDAERLERSLQLVGERVGTGRYRVTGGAQDHWVDLYTTSHPRCDCGDHLWREQLCKHILAALLREGNDRVVSALGRLFAELRDLRKAA